MDAFARGLKIAAAIRADGALAEIVKDRYDSWESGIGAEIEAGKHNFESLESYMLEKGNACSQQEWTAGDDREPDQRLLLVRC